jgi:PhzF family phenazine biosynthesis protein
MAKVPILQVDSFTAAPFRGNPAAVCLLQEEPNESWMQSVAEEMNLSETAFVVPRPGGEFSIRWFTPTVEVPLCGHATLAAAHALWEEKAVAPGAPILFRAKTGTLGARREADWICLDFPAIPVEEMADPPALSDALGCEPVEVQWSRLPAYVAVLASEDAVRGLEPSVATLRGIGEGTCIVTAASETGDFDFVSRFFAPGLGIDEDPVTGAAHCTLGPFWARRTGKNELTGHQVSRRGGIVRVRVRGDRLDLLGQAVTVMRGEMPV